MSQIIRITSEALQASIRRLLPSQQGFGEDLQASNVITPIIDLTPTAEGSALPEYLQRSISLVDANVFNINNATSTIINTAGFCQITGAISHNINAGATNAILRITDGATTKILFNFSEVIASTASEIFFTYIETPVICVASGESVEFVAGGSTLINGSCRQIADINGNLIDPAPYQPQ